MKRLAPGLLLGAVGALVLIGSGFYFITARQDRVERADSAPVIVIAPTKPPANAAPANSPAAQPPRATPTPLHSVTIELDTLASSTKPTATFTSTFTAFDFLQDYLTNRTYPNIVAGTPWTNNSVNVQQYSQNLGGVTYWDFWSEPENWDSPFYMYQDDNGNWHPYQTVTIRNAAGRNVSAYLLVDRNGPGVMDKIWFTEDAVWMLETAQSRADVGLIADMQDFVEWGNL
jgi:hypothetical protein